MSIIVNHTTTTTTSSSSLTDSKLDLTEKSTASESTLQLFPESPSHHKLRQTMAEQAILEDCDLRKIISETTVQQLLEATTLNRQTGHKSPLVPVCLDSHLTVQEGCAALAYHKISSAPIYDQALGGFVGKVQRRGLTGGDYSFLSLSYRNAGLQGSRCVCTGSLQKTAKRQGWHCCCCLERSWIDCGDGR